MEAIEEKGQYTSQDFINNTGMPSHSIPKHYSNPAIFFPLIVIMIFASEAAVIYVVSNIRYFQTFNATVIHAALLTTVLFPMLYFLFLKPFRSCIHEFESMGEKLNKEIITDDLTGLLNRRGLFTIAQNQCELATRNDFDLSFIFLDVDGMKMINDKFGHIAGDEALVAVASILKKSFRSSDIIGRIGGDEFTVIVTGVPEGDNEAVTRRLHNNIANYNARIKKPYNLSISMGITKYSHKNPCSIDELYSTADKMMYEQKRKKCAIDPVKH